MGQVAGAPKWTLGGGAPKRTHMPWGWQATGMGPPCPVWVWITMKTQPMGPYRGCLRRSAPANRTFVGAPSLGQSATGQRACPSGPAGDETRAGLWLRGGGGRVEEQGTWASRTQTAGQAMDGLWTEVCGQQKQSNDPGNNQHIINTPIIGRR